MLIFIWNLSKFQKKHLLLRIELEVRQRKMASNALLRQLEKGKEPIC